MLLFSTLFDEITRLVHEGKYDPALKAAKRLSIDLLKQNQRGEAAAALAAAGQVLCLLNSPAKARSFAQEAQDMAQRAGHIPAAGYAQAVRALAHLRAAEFEPAEAQIDKALETLHKHPEHVVTAFAQLVSAEISLTQEDYAEARVFAEDAFAAGASLGQPWIKARACLIKAVCEERTGGLEAAIGLLNTAEQELKNQPDAETSWLVKAAIANACLKAGQEKAAKAAKQACVDQVKALASGLESEAAERFLKNPAIVGALGEEVVSRSGLWKVPVQIPSPRAAGDDKLFGNLRPVLDVIKKINTELNLRKLITMILDTMIEFCNALRGTIVMFEGARFKLQISRDRAKKELKGTEMGLSRTILKLVRDHGKRIVAEDAQQDPSLKLIDSVQDNALLSVLCVPLRMKTRLIGAVYLDNPAVVSAFGPREIEIAEILTDHAAVAIDNTLLHIKSIHDGLTNLFNHGHFEKRLESEIARARRHGRSCGLLMMDIDDFKRVNDDLGHDAGNEILKTTAHLLSATIRGADFVARIQEREVTPIVARYGGDEFEIVLPEATREGVRIVADRVLAAVQKEEFKYGDKVLKLAFSIGGAVYPEDAADARELLLKADEALYIAKRSGKNRAHLTGDSQKPVPSSQ